MPSRKDVRELLSYALLLLSIVASLACCVAGAENKPMQYLVYLAVGVVAWYAGLEIGL